MVETLNNLSESDKNLKTKKKRITVKKVNIPELVYSSQKAKEIRNKNDQKLKEKNNQNEEKELKQAMDYFYTPNPDFHLDLKKEIVGYDNRKDYNKSENNKNSLRIKKREENIRNWEQKKVDLAKDLESYKKNAFKLIEKIFKLRGKENYTENFKKAVELLKTKQIKQIIVAGNLANKDINIPRIDLDTWSSLKLLNNYNQKNYNETYTEGAETKIVGKDFKIEEYLKENANKDGDGIVIVLDTGGEWLKVFNQTNNEEIFVAIDHHGHGEGPDTSGTKMIYNLMDKADILKEKSWQKDYVRAVNNIDNLNYIYEKDKSGSNIFNKEYFLNSWTRSLAAYVEKEIPFEETLKLFKEKRIKDIAEPLTNDQIIGKIGDISVKIKVGKDYQEMSLRKAIPFKRKEVINSLNNAEEILKYNYKHNLLTESKDFGNVLYQNYQSKRVYPNGREVANKIDNNLAFKVLKAMGGDTFISYNQKYNYYYINSDFADLQLLAEVINEKYKGSANEVRGRFIFGKISEGMTEESFNNILKDFKNMAKVLNIRDEKVDQERLSEKKELSKEEVEKLKKEKGRKSK